MAGPIPTPAISFLTKSLHLSAGIVISASHNPYTDNGIKFFGKNGAKLPDSVELEIEAQLAKDMLIANRLGKVSRLDDVKGRYIEFCKNTFPSELDLSGLKIVLDCANGATYQVAPQVFKELGASIIKVACDPDGININNQCGSTYPATLVDAVKKHNADLGIAFDGDGDRVLFVDNLGKVYNGDKLIYVILQLYLSQGKDIRGLVGTVMTNLAMEHALNKNGLELVRAKVGDRYVLEELLKHNWLIGGEASGHVLCLDKHTTGDSIVSALQVLAGITRLKKSLADLIDWEDYPQSMINVVLDCNNIHWQKKINSLISEAQENLRDTGRVVVRASGTEQLVRVMVEARSHDVAVTWANKIAQKIKQ
jgi:phosphoglucosamine mutase